MKDAFAVSYAADEKNNKKAANAAKKIAYMESIPEFENLLLKPKEENAKVSTLMYKPEKVKQESVKYANSSKREKDYQEYSSKQKENTKNEEKSFWDKASDLLAVASFIPGLDSITNIASIPVDLIRGDYVSALLDLIGVIPVVGELADAAKTTDKVVDGLKLVDKANDTVKAIDSVNDINKTVSTTSPYKLTQTQNLTLSKKQYSDLVENIRTNGITESIKYVDIDGTKYVVDGHHRLQAAKDLKLKEIPIEEVSLPYKGYKTVEDLKWLD